MKRILAAFIFFTRLPFWRLAEVPPSYYSRVVELWPLTGWVTALIASGALWICSEVLGLPPMAAVTLALGMRLLVTGALHEDGLADFADGMGGGVSRESILKIMKDSHIGTYGVLMLICYYILAVSLLAALSPLAACSAIVAADPLSKWCASQVINFLPYARKEHEAKNKTVYTRMGAGAWLCNSLCGLLPMMVFIPWRLWIAAVLPLLVTSLMIWMMRRRIGGYTGDCCGAVFLIDELSFYIAFTVLINILHPEL